jgi:ketosteroid isomerase-like protein
MELRENYKNLCVKFFSLMNSCDFAQMPEFLHDDASFDFPGTKTIEGKKRIVLFLTAMTRKYKNLKFDILHILVDEDKACVVWKNSASEPNGNQYRNSGISFFRFKDSKIDYISDYFKDTSFTTN